MDSSNRGTIDLVALTKSIGDDLAATTLPHPLYCVAFDEVNDRFTIEQNVGTSTSCSVLLYEKLHCSSFARICLPKEASDAVSVVQSLAVKYLWSLPEPGKLQMTKAFKKAAMWMRTNFSFAHLKAPGKETFKVRRVGAHDELRIPHFEGLEELLGAALVALIHLHCVSRALLTELDGAVVAKAGCSVLAFAEEVFAISEKSPMSLSHVNLLHYFDNSKEMPVREHTDAYIFTLIPLNTFEPALDVFDTSLKEWTSIDSNGEAPFREAVLLIGETLSFLTRDFFTATLHRVHQLSSVDRFSLPFFLSADFDAMLECVWPGDDSDNIESKAIATGLFLWEQTKIANANPSSEESIKERLAKHTRSELS